MKWKLYVQIICFGCTYSYNFPLTLSPESWKEIVMLKGLGNGKHTAFSLLDTGWTDWPKENSWSLRFWGGRCERGGGFSVFLCKELSQKSWEKIRLDCELVCHKRLILIDDDGKHEMRSPKM